MTPPSENARTMSASDRNALRTLVKKQTEALHSDVDAREAAMRSEVESALLDMYREQSAAIEKARKTVTKLQEKFTADLRKLAEALSEQHPGLQARVKQSSDYYWPKLEVDEANKAQERRVAIAGIPKAAKAAHAAVNAAEVGLIRDITLDGIDTDLGRDLLDRIPTAESVLPKVTDLKILEAHAPAGSDKAPSYEDRWTEVN